MHAPHDQEACDLHRPCSTGRFAALALAALGVVYGDIGTSPLYAVKECFHGMHAMPVTHANVLGVLSLIFWSLTAVISFKYVLFIMRADNEGEGGIFALLALLMEGPNGQRRALPAVVAGSALMGAALLYGDGIITPAISVLSAVEGLNVATDAAAPYVPLITCAILVGLFMIQSHGTERLGAILGPIMLVWFAVLFALGLGSIVLHPQVLAAVNPAYALQFFMENGVHGAIVLASVVLCITGGEALYADMGHFGAGPIRLSWYLIVFPSLLTNYFGQGALLLDNPSKSFQPFFSMVPQSMLIPMVILSTLATIIASQALISGVFSLTQQAIQLGFLPRMGIVHTSAETKGQIYIPVVNYGLMLACLGLVLAFKESSRLAAAYGIAVTATMGITSLLYYGILRQNWGWSRRLALPLVGAFLVFDVAFLGSNLLKFLDGGWFTVSVAVAVYLVMQTWRQGRALLASPTRVPRLPLRNFLEDIARKPPVRVPGTAVFMSITPEGVPITLLHHFKHNKVLHERIVILTIASGASPHLDDAERIRVQDYGQGFYRVTARFGFMESPSVPKILELAGRQGLVLHMPQTTFFLGRETLLRTGKSGLAQWRKDLFIFMSRNAVAATRFFDIPTDRVVELGAQVEL